MELTKQVTSLELSKRLKELGVKQESAFFWVEACGSAEWSLKSDEALDHMASLAADDYAAAFTATQLGEMLPAGYASAHGKDMKWICFCEFKRSGDEGYMKHGDTEADARANMLIYLTV